MVPITLRRRIDDGVGVAAKIIDCHALSKQKFGNESALVMIDREINIMKQVLLAALAFEHNKLRVRARS